MWKWEKNYYLVKGGYANGNHHNDAAAFFFTTLLNFEMVLSNIDEIQRVQQYANPMSSKAFDS